MVPRFLPMLVEPQEWEGYNKASTAAVHGWTGVLARVMWTEWSM
jgi:hypothetical protein